MRKIALIALLTLVFGCLFSAGCYSPQHQGSFAPEVLAEFKIEGGAKPILLPVTLDGKEYDFILDTGATTTVFDASLKDKLGKRFLWPKKGKAAGGKTIKVELFRIPRAYLGSLNMRDCGLIAVIDLELVSSALARKAHGIIGMDFLKKYVLRIDFDKATVSFLKSKRDTGIFSFLKPEKNEHPEWGQPLSIKYEFLSGLPLVKGRIVNDVPVNFMIDTGHVIPQVDGDLKSRIFKKVCSKVEFKTKEGFNKAAIIDKFSIGSFEYRDAIFYESNQSSLGMGFLRRHLVTFDFPGRKMYLKKGEHFDRPTDTRISVENLGLKLRRHRNNIFVDSIDPNGPAYKKGIRQNDIIIKLDDQDVTSYSLTELVEFLSQLHKEEDKVITFTVKRGNETKHVSFGKNDMERERYEQALEETETALDIQPDNELALANRVHILTQTEPLKAEEYSRQLVEKDPNNSHWWFWYHRALMTLDRYEEALEAVQKAVDLNPNGLYYGGLANALAKLDRLDEAEPYYKRMTKDCGCQQCWFKYARFLIDNRPDKLDEAEKALDLADAKTQARVSKKGLNNLRTDLNLVRIRSLKKESPAKAEVLTRQLLEMSPENGHYWHALADILRDLVKYEQAAQASQKAVRLCPDYPYRPRLANCLAKAGRLQQARQTYNEMLTDHPQRPRYWFWYARFLNEYHPDKLEEARQALAKAETASDMKWFVSPEDLTDLREKINLKASAPNEVESKHK